MVANVLRAEFTDDRRTGARYPVILKLPARINGRSRVLNILDISETGFLTEADISLEPGGLLEIDLPDEKSAQAEIAWASEDLAGCAFVGPLSRALISAARLKSAFENANEFGEPTEHFVSNDDDIDDEPVRHEKYPVVVGATVVFGIALLSWAATIWGIVSLFG